VIYAAAMRVHLATCKVLPEPDPDEALLVDALKREGVDASLLAWDDESHLVSAPLTILRSTWNYFAQREAFLAWAEKVSRVSVLMNPLPTITWNSHKSYLATLEAKGVDVVPTRFAPKGAIQSLKALIGESDWKRIVVKPTVSAGSFSTANFEREDPKAEEFFQNLVREREVMVQPYVQSVEGYGERSVIAIAGELTHAIRKSPRFGTAPEAASDAQPIAEDERALALQALSTVHGQLLYARVDMARDEQGKPRIMELELTEPSLFLAQSEMALARFAKAIRQKVEALIS